jgi:hypothetical protein
LSEPEKVKVYKAKLLEILDMLRLPDVASGDPVGTLSVPKVPE